MRWSTFRDRDGRERVGVWRGDRLHPAPEETTLLTLYTTFMHWGSILVPPGYTDDVIYAAGGNPYGTSVTAKEGAPTDEEKAAIRHQTLRLLDVTERLKSGRRTEEGGRRGWKTPSGAGSR